MIKNNLIQGLWIGKSLSLMENLSIKSFLAHGQIYHLYVYDKVRNVPEGCVIKDANEILRRSNIFKYKYGDEKGSYAGFANLFRFKLLFEKAGIWADLDVVCLKKFDFKSPYIFTSQSAKNKSRATNNAVIKVPANSRIIADCYGEAKSIDNKHLKWRQNGSDLLAKYIRKYKIESSIVSPGTFCPINWWEWFKFLENGFDVETFKTSYAIHLWHEMWRRAALPEADKNVLHGSKTLYGCLQRMYL